MQSIIAPVLDRSSLLFNACKLNLLTFKHRLRQRIGLYRLGLRYAIGRYRRGLRYATEQWNADDARQIAYECEDVAGRWTLESFDLEGVLEDAHTLWHDHPEIERLALDAAAHVANKWCAYGDGQDAARGATIQKMQEFAIDADIELVEH